MVRNEQRLTKIQILGIMAALIAGLISVGFIIALLIMIFFK